MLRQSQPSSLTTTAISNVMISDIPAPQYILVAEVAWSVGLVGYVVCDRQLTLNCGFQD